MLILFCLVATFFKSILFRYNLQLIVPILNIDEFQQMHTSKDNLHQYNKKYMSICVCIHVNRNTYILCARVCVNLGESIFYVKFFQFEDQYRLV